MESKLSSKGLSVLAVTSEGTRDTEEWIAKKQAKYAYAYSKNGSLGRFLGVGGIPHAALIDSEGLVVWTGSPFQIDEKQVEALLSGALTKPLWEWPAAARAAKSAYVRGQVGTALAEARKLAPNDGGAEVVAAIEAQVAARVQNLELEWRRGNYLAVEDAAKQAKTRYAGLPQLAQIEALAKQVEAAPNAAQILAAQRKIQKLREEKPSKRKDREKAQDELRKLLLEFPGTYVAQEADELIQDLARLK